nr:hypothetical protein [Lysobacter oculi]
MSCGLPVDRERLFDRVGDDRDIGRGEEHFFVRELERQRPRRAVFRHFDVLRGAEMDDAEHGDVGRVVGDHGGGRCRIALHHGLPERCFQRDDFL